MKIILSILLLLAFFVRCYTLAKWASVLYVFSYGLVVYARWFSHPPLTLPLTILLFWSLFNISRGRINNYLWLTLSWGLIFHLEMAAALFFLPGILIFILWQKPLLPDTKVTAGIIVILWVISAPVFGILLNSMFGLKHYMMGLAPGIIIVATWALSHYKIGKLISAKNFGQIIVQKRTTVY